MIEVSVFIEGTGRGSTEWWTNFWVHYEELGFDMRNDVYISKALAEWKAINVIGTTMVRFKNKHDYLLFMLRWA